MIYIITLASVALSAVWLPTTSFHIICSQNSVLNLDATYYHDWLVIMPT